MPNMFESMARGAAWDCQHDVHGTTVTHHNFEADTDDTSVKALQVDTGTIVEEDDMGDYVVRTAEFTILPADIASVDPRNHIIDADGVIWDVDDIPQRSPYILYSCRSRTERHSGTYGMGD